MTRTEVVVVVSVILILLALIPTPGPIARTQARMAQAKVDCVEIEAAVKAYYTEYGEYPLGSNATQLGSISSTDFIYGQSPDSPSIGSGVSNCQLFDILRNIDSTGHHASGPTEPLQP